MGSADILLVLGLVGLFVYGIVDMVQDFRKVKKEIRARLKAEEDGSVPLSTVPNSDLMAVDVTPSKPNYVFLNYNFREMDAEQSPSDPSDFFDELWIEVNDLDKEHKWMYVRTVCTPKGLRRVMTEDGHEFVNASGFLFVRRYDLQTILAAVKQELDKAHAEAEQRASEASS